MSINYNVI